MSMFSAFVFIYLLAATMFYAYIVNRAKEMPEPASERTHPPKTTAEIVELYPQHDIDERKAA